MLKSPYSQLASLASQARADKARNAKPLAFAPTVAAFKPRSFDPGSPSTRAIDAALARVERDQREADALRDGYRSYQLRSGTFG